MEIPTTTSTTCGRTRGGQHELSSPKCKRDLRFSNQACSIRSRPHYLSTSCMNKRHLLSCHLCKKPVILGTLLQLIHLFAMIATIAYAQHDVMPQQYQHNNILHFSVEENRPNGSHIGTIRSSDGQVPYLVVPSPQTPEFELKSAFNINFTTGDLTTNSQLDREHREQYHFIAIVREPFAEIKCTVTVKDANDNAPMFLTPASNETNFVIDILEGHRGLRTLLPLAVDLDTQPFGIKEFRIISGNTPSGTFHLVEHEAPPRSAGNLGTAADDTAAAMLAAGADNPQLIQQLTQQATVLIPSQPIMQASLQNQQSVGASSGAASGPTVSQQSKYLIDLEVSQPLDRENQSSYQLVIEAIDGGQPPLFGRLSVTVNVQDVNDNDPIFPRKSYETHISEDTPKGALVHRVQAYDADLDSNGRVSYFIKRHTSSSQPAQNVVVSAGSKPIRSAYNSDQLFDIDPNKGEIYLANQLDFEMEQQHELLIEARDHGKPSRSSYTTVKVYVIDVHDDPPVISRAVEERRVSSGESKAESSPRMGSEYTEAISQPSFNLNNFNLSSWLAQMNSSMLFVIVFVALVAIAFPVCLIKIKSRQPESDYNDTAGLTLSSNNGQAKPSPNHSSSNLEHSGGLNGAGSFGVPNGKMSCYQYSDNLYHNPYPPPQRPRHHSSNSHHMPPDSSSDHQMVDHSQGGSRGGTMTLMPHHHHQMLGHNSSAHHHVMDHHHFGSANHGTSSLTYAHHHSRAALLQHAHHHQSSHQLSSVHQVMNGLNKGGTMNLRPGQNGILHETTGSTQDSCGTPAGTTTPQPLDRWFDLGVVPQLVNPQDWCSSYNWDYLRDWTPEYHTLMPIIETMGSGY